MQTSTPLPPSTPSRPSRRSMAPPMMPGPSFFGGRPDSTPVRKDGESVAAQLDASNDDIERSKRRLSAALRKTISNLPGATDSSSINESRRKSLSEEDIKQHLQICTKLHAENKINIKNAWKLDIIDVLKHMVTRNNPDILKVAGSSLEIAGKVYGLRVDDLHAEGLKLAGSLARNFNKRSREDEEDEENVDPNSPAQKRQRKEKKQKKRRPLLSGDKKHTVNADPKSCRGALPILESAAFSARTDTTVSAVANLFTNKVKMDPGGYKFIFLCKEKAWQWAPGIDPSLKEDTNKKFRVQVKTISNFMLCAPFRDFYLDEWNPDEENRELSKRMSARELDDVVCDDNGIPIAELDGSIHDVFQDRDSHNFSDDDPVEEEVVVPHLHQDIANIVDFRPTDQGFANTIERSDYSYNSIITTSAGKIDQIWAGPSHWKLKFIRRSQPVYTGQDQQKEQDGKNKKRGPKMKDKAVALDMAGVPHIDFASLAKVQPKRKNPTVDKSKITLPLLHSACAQLLDNIDGLMTVPSMKPAKKPTSAVDYEIEGYRYDNPNDSRYIPLDAENDDNGADLGDDNFDNDHGDNIASTPDFQEAAGTGHLTGTNLVKAPQMVPQTYLHYATRAKKMDMKKLKHAVWCTLTGTVEYDTSAKVVPTTFSQMSKDVIVVLPEKMRQELSHPLTFVALLHLCNEQNLKLTQQDVTDFHIFGPSI